MFVRVYFRTSPSDADGEQARSKLETFTLDHGLRVVSWYVEYHRDQNPPQAQLLRLIDDARQGDILIVDKIDHISHGTDVKWFNLKDSILEKQLRIISLDLPTTWLFSPNNNGKPRRENLPSTCLILEMLAATSRKGLEWRKSRQKAGIEIARSLGKYRGGKGEDEVRNSGIIEMIKSGVPHSKITAATGCSRATIFKLSNRIKADPSYDKAAKPKNKPPGRPRNNIVDVEISKLLMAGRSAGQIQIELGCGLRTIRKVKARLQSTGGLPQANRSKKGREPNHERNKIIAEMLRNKVPWLTIQYSMSCSKSTVARVAAKLRESLSLPSSLPALHADT